MSAFENIPRITPFLWFDTNAEEAVDLYVAVFKNARKIGVMRSSADTPRGPKGSVLTVSFEIEGLHFTAMNGGPGHKFTDAISFVITCDTQQEIDHYWTKLTADGGSEVACGWLKDKFGLSWQVVPARMGELLKHPKAMQAMMQMKKLDIAVLENAGKE